MLFLVVANYILGPLYFLYASGLHLPEREKPYPIRNGIVVDVAWFFTLN